MAICVAFIVLEGLEIASVAVLPRNDEEEAPIFDKRSEAWRLCRGDEEEEVSPPRDDEGGVAGVSFLCLATRRALLAQEASCPEESAQSQILPSPRQIRLPRRE